MAYVIDQEKCIGCGECAAACPTEAISADGDKFVINAEECISCGICAGTCPTEAISE